MDYLYGSVILFNIATFGYLLATIVLTVALVKKSDKLLKIFGMMGVVIVTAHTGALLLRWAEAGFDRPPWTNLYESLVFFSWGLGLISTTVALRYKTHFLATLLYPLTFAGLGLASLVPEKGITPLVPSLQSYWIKIHVVMAVMAYPGFVTAGAVSLAYLFKSKTSLAKLNLGFALTALFFLLTVGQSDVLTEATFRAPTMVMQSEGVFAKVPVDPMAEKIEWQMEILPYVGSVFLATIFAYLLTVGYALGAIKDPENPMWDKVRRVANTVAFVLYAATVGLIYWYISTRDTLTLSSNPYQMAILDILLGVQALFLLYATFRKGVDSILPSAEWLDDFSYKMTLFAFPFMTLLLITGAIWAYSAWGRYWGWDPKETCALITWMIFAGYLHSRKYFGRNGAPSAVISVIGAVSVFFTFLGANLLLSGLHAYGAQ